MTTDTYYSNVNPHLLKLIPKKANRLLELGCGGGSLGAAYKEHVNPEAHYQGVELVAAAAQVALRKLDRVIVGNVEVLSNEDLDIEEASLDCLIYGDVLEHLIDPWKELAKRKKLLKNKGHVLACIPNLQHWSVIYKIIADQWAYEDSGILDRTHLRFFTRSGIQDLFTSAGLKVMRMIGIPESVESGTPFVRGLFPVLEPMGIDAQKFETQAGNYQYLVKAIRVMDRETA